MLCERLEAPLPSNSDVDDRQASHRRAYRDRDKFPSPNGFAREQARREHQQDHQQDVGDARVDSSLPEVLLELLQQIEPVEPAQELTSGEAARISLGDTTFLEQVGTRHASHHGAVDAGANAAAHEPHRAGDEHEAGDSDRNQQIRGFIARPF